MHGRRVTVARAVAIAAMAAIAFGSGGAAALEEEREAQVVVEVADGDVVNAFDLVYEAAPHLDTVLAVDLALQHVSIQFLAGGELCFATLVDVLRANGVELQVRPHDGREVLFVRRPPYRRPARPIYDVVTAVCDLAHLDDAEVQAIARKICERMGEDPHRAGRAVVPDGTRTLVLADRSEALEEHLVVVERLSAR